MGKKKAKKKPAIAAGSRDRNLVNLKADRKKKKKNTEIRKEGRGWCIRKRERGPYVN